MICDIICGDMINIHNLRVDYETTELGEIKSISVNDQDGSRITTTLIGGTKEQVSLVRPGSEGLFVVPMHHDVLNQVIVSPYIPFEELRRDQERFSSETKGQYKQLYRDIDGFAPYNSLSLKLQEDPKNKSNEAQIQRANGRSHDDISLCAGISLIANGGLSVYILSNDDYQSLEAGFELFALPYDSVSRAWLSRKLIPRKSVMLIFQAATLKNGIVVATRLQH